MTRAVRSATVGMVLVLVARLAARLRLLQAIPAIPARPGSERAKHNKRVLGPDQPALSFRARRRFLPMSLASNAGVASPALGMASMPAARSPSVAIVCELHAQSLLRKVADRENCASIRPPCALQACPLPPRRGRASCAPPRCTHASQFGSAAFAHRCSVTIRRPLSHRHGNCVPRRTRPQGRGATTR